jgi:predicted nucleic acid-binding protein
MNGRVAKYVLLDTGFWIGLLDPRDGRHQAARSLYETIEAFHVLVPWPTLYEFVGTALTKRHEHVARLAESFLLPGVERIDDGPYRESALAACLHKDARRRPMSLVDRVLRQMIEDASIRLHAVATFNARDFADVCRSRNLELLVGTTHR